MNEYQKNVTKELLQTLRKMEDRMQDLQNQMFQLTLETYTIMYRLELMQIDSEE